MRHLSKLFISTFIIFPSLASAGFDFGGDGEGCDGGNGKFKQQINHYGGDYENAITVGTIKKGLKDVYITLKSDKDVDIRLYDANGKKIVHWPSGVLSDAVKGSTSYNGVTVEYSGYNGDGTGLGHEYIKISGTIKNDFVMKAFGYKAGYANVDYSWAGKENCSGGGSPSASGSGDFQQQILNKAIVTVGDIPPGVNNLYITLKSDKDVDIQLYDKDNGKKIVHWPDGIISGASKQTTTYENMGIEWSGYNGDGTGLGNEYIKITGKTTRNLTMKAYGYKAGYAKVHYEWGGDVPATIKGLKFISATPASGKNYAEVGENITFKASTYSSSNGKIKAFIQFHTGVDYLSKVAMKKNSSTLWTYDRTLKAGKQKKYKVIVEDLNGNIIDSQVKSIEVKDKVIETTYSYPYSTSEYPNVYISQGNDTGSHKGKGKYAYDFAIAVGQNVRAARSGKVIRVKENSSTHGTTSAYANYANYVVIDHGNNEVSLYLHLQKNSVPYTVGQTVNKGDIIGKVGLTGWVIGAHLHFQVQSNCNSWWCQSKDINFD